MRDGAAPRENACWGARPAASSPGREVGSRRPSWDHHSSSRPRSSSATPFGGLVDKTSAIKTLCLRLPESRVLSLRAVFLAFLHGLPLPCKRRENQGCRLWVLGSPQNMFTPSNDKIPSVSSVVWMGVYFNSPLSLLCLAGDLLGILSVGRLNYWSPLPTSLTPASCLGTEWVAW